MSFQPQPVPSPQVAVPPPWALRGRAFIFAVRMPQAAQAAAGRFAPPELLPTLRAPLSLAMLVDYQETPAGPYQELLYLPGSFQFSDGRRPSITRILVSTWASVENGRRNWGIGKDRCDFDWQRQPGTSQETVRVHQDDGAPIAHFQLRSRGPALPVPGHWLPAGLRTLSQRWEGTQFTYTPEARGRMTWATVEDWSFNPDQFPDLARGTCVAALHIPDFRMTFPVPRVT